MRRSHKLALWLVALGLLSWCVASFFVAWKLTRRDPRFDELPIASVAPGRELNWRASDGVEGSAWWTPARGSSMPVVLLLHSLHSTRGEWTAVVDSLAERGVASCAPSLRCHGSSGGDVLEFGRAARLDVITLVQEIEALAPDRPIVVMGRSLGAAAALFAAEELGERVSGYLLEAPYPDLSTAMRNRTRRELGALLGTVAAFGLDLVAPVFLNEPSSIAPARVLSELRDVERVWLLAGALDRETPLPEMESMSQSRDPHIRLEVFEGAAHVQCLATDSERWWRLVDEQLQRARR